MTRVVNASLFPQFCASSRSRSKIAAKCNVMTYRLVPYRVAIQAIRDAFKHLDIVRLIFPRLAHQSYKPRFHSQSEYENRDFKEILIDNSSSVDQILSKAVSRLMSRSVLLPKSLSVHSEQMVLIRNSSVATSLRLLVLSSPHPASSEW